LGGEVEGVEGVEETPTKLSLPAQLELQAPAGSGSYLAQIIYQAIN